MAAICPFREQVNHFPVNNGRKTENFRLSFKNKDGWWRVRRTGDPACVQRVEGVGGESLLPHLRLIGATQKVINTDLCQAGSIHSRVQGSRYFLAQRFCGLHFEICTPSLFPTLLSGVNI